MSKILVPYASTPQLQSFAQNTVTAKLFALEKVSLPHYDRPH